MEKITVIGLALIIFGLVLIVLQFVPNLRLKLRIIGFGRSGSYRGFIGGPILIIMGILILTGVLR
jgi:uncharacterized membrane protein